MGRRKRDVAAFPLAMWYWDIASNGLKLLQQLRMLPCAGDLKDNRNLPGFPRIRNDLPGWFTLEMHVIVTSSNYKSIFVNDESIDLLLVDDMVAIDLVVWLKGLIESWMDRLEVALPSPHALRDRIESEPFNSLFEKLYEELWNSSLDITPEESAATWAIDERLMRLRSHLRSLGVGTRLPAVVYRSLFSEAMLHWVDQQSPRVMNAIRAATEIWSPEWQEVDLELENLLLRSKDNMAKSQEEAKKREWLDRQNWAAEASRILKIGDPVAREKAFNRLNKMKRDHFRIDQRSFTSCERDILILMKEHNEPLIGSIIEERFKGKKDDKCYSRATIYKSLANLKDKGIIASGGKGRDSEGYRLLEPKNSLAPRE
jgi:hypothetical protein